MNNGSKTPTGRKRKATKKTAVPADARSFAALLLFLVIHTLLRIVPRGLLFRFGEWVGRAVGRLQVKESMIASAQLRFALGLRALSDQQPEEAPLGSVTELKALQPSIDRIFAAAGRTGAEFFAVDRILRRDRAGKFKHISASDISFIKEYLENGRSVVALGGHLGCFELLAAYHCAAGLPMAVVAREANYPLLNKMLEKGRSFYGAQVLWRNDKSTPLRLLECLREGVVLGLLIDQDINLENAFAKFFGLDAASSAAMLKLAVRRKLPVVSSFTFRTGALSHQIVTQEIKYDPADPGAVETILSVYNARLEKFIRAYPHQWPWWHRRWRRRPGIDYDSNPDQLFSTQNYLAWLRSQTPASH